MTRVGRFKGHQPLHRHQRNDRAERQRHQAALDLQAPLLHGGTTVAGPRGQRGAFLIKGDDHQIEVGRVTRQAIGRIRCGSTSGVFPDGQSRFCPDCARGRSAVRLSLRTGRRAWLFPPLTPARGAGRPEWPAVSLPADGAGKAFRRKPHARYCQIVRPVARRRAPVFHCRYYGRCTAEGCRGYARPFPALAVRARRASVSSTRSAVRRKASSRRAIRFPLRKKFSIARSAWPPI
ncbi:Uncharacterised protein [Raoultella planticola]|nr:Uncharacterised protein [Raoultella planticola]